MSEIAPAAESPPELAAPTAPAPGRYDRSLVDGPLRPAVWKCAHAG